MMKKCMKWISLALVCAALVVALPDPVPVEATSALEESIKQKQEAIAQAQEERKKLQSDLSNVKTVVAELEKTKNSLSEYVKELDGQLTGVETKIQELKTLIAEKEEEIEKTKAELEEAVKVEETQYEEMKTRIKFMYEKGDRFYFEMMLGASNFSDLLNKAEYVESISAYDRQKLEEYQLNRQLIEVCKQELEEEEAVLQEAKVAVEEQQAKLETLISTKEKEIVNYETDISNKEEAIRQYEADIAAENATIAALEKAVAEEMRLLNNANAPTYDGGMFKWPCPSYTRISDEYGWRIHPTLGVRKFHNGIDMAAPGGSPILAAYGGVVVAADYNSTMGNYIMINHGGGLYTIYMHASALYVSTGQTVSMGDKIAAVGTTGRSTGNHLHFGVRLNGEYVNPNQYLGR
ncbi:MAG: peptidoglycan DD-metalloendopeptidase family protein [Lachnospiraceae bacterium]|nr:peptidoglycan DD-metalloendopeptidase family protein [Lachnospiraceae bacterium]MDD7026442.1 peptidoglycan DD-metalloendopeptidase family protein [Lachnospiraceae bacterium]MDY5700819.1 peptidoglycan DD-metalloendopeptidase family protein [Lachnospiraceae bacterium]